MSYRGWLISHAPARPSDQQYLACRAGVTLFSSSPIGLLGLVNNAIAQVTIQGDSHV